MTEHDRDRIDQELEKVRAEYQEAKKLHEKQEEMDELRQRIENNNFEERWTHNLEEKFGVGLGFAQFTNSEKIEGLKDSAPIAITLDAEQLPSRWTHHYFMAAIFGETLYSLSLYYQQKYYLSRRFAVGAGGGLNYNSLLSEEDILAEDGEATQTEGVLVASLSFSPTDKFSVEGFYSMAILSNSPLFRGVRVESLNRFLINLKFSFTM